MLQLELFLKQQCQNKILKSRRLPAIMDFPLNMYHLFQRRCKYIGWLCVCLSCRSGMEPVLISQAANRFVFPSHHNQSPSGHRGSLGNISKSWTFDYLIGLKWPVHGAARCQSCDLNGVRSSGYRNPR